MSDETFDAGEPAYDAPPRFRDADERRMHARAYSHWASLLRGGALPLAGDLDPVGLGGFATNSVLIEIEVGTAAPALRFIGPRLREQSGLGDGVSAGDRPQSSLVARLLARVPQVLAARAPVGFADEFASARGSELLCRGVLLPLSSDGEHVDLIHGVISWKEVVAPEMSRRIAAELGDAARVTRAAQPPLDPFA